MADALIEQLEATGVDYEIIDCDPDLADTAQFCEAYGYSPGDSANTILVIAITGCRSAASRRSGYQSICPSGSMGV